MQFTWLYEEENWVLEGASRVDPVADATPINVNPKGAGREWEVMQALKGRTFFLKQFKMVWFMLTCTV